MKRLAFFLASLFISLSAFSQMVRENPVAGCKITKQYGMETITYTLSGKFHIAKPGEFADLKVYIAKKGDYYVISTEVEFSENGGVRKVTLGRKI